MVRSHSFVRVVTAGLFAAAATASPAWAQFGRMTATPCPPPVCQPCQPGNVPMSPNQTPYIPAPTAAPPVAPMPGAIPTPDAPATPQTQAPQNPAGMNQSAIDTLFGGAAGQGSNPLDSGSSLSDLVASVGYLDDPLIGTKLRLRYDTAYRSNRPTRAEYFYAHYGPGAPGLPLPEKDIDYQELHTYFEYAFTRNVSAFIDVPVRWLNPTINENSNGLGDIQAGFRYAIVNREDRVITAQLRAYAPSGDAHKGLGTDHASIEPGILVYQNLSENVNFYGEVQYWIGIPGDSFTGSLLRYGMGLSYGKVNPCGWWVTPIVEAMGWSVVDGMTSVFVPPMGGVAVDASGDTIFNVKLGARVGHGTNWDVYAGYGRAVTGEVWYKDLVRVEGRIRF